MMQKVNLDDLGANNYGVATAFQRLVKTVNELVDEVEKLKKPAPKPRTTRKTSTKTKEE